MKNISLIFKTKLTKTNKLKWINLKQKYIKIMRKQKNTITKIKVKTLYKKIYFIQEFM